MEDVIRSLRPWYVLWEALCFFAMTKKEQEEQVHHKISYIMCLSSSIHALWS